MENHTFIGARIYTSQDRKLVTSISGIDMQAKVEIISWIDEYIAFKRNGYTGWAGHGRTKYYRPQYYLVKLDGDTIVSVLFDAEVSRQSSASTRKKLIEMVVGLARKEPPQ